MKEFALKKLLGPIVSRIGTAVGFSLVGTGLFSEDMVVVVSSAFVVLFGLAFDLVVDFLRLREKG